MKIFTQTFILVVALATIANSAHAYDFDIPFTISGFGLVTLSRASHQCPDCQLDENEERHKIWADAIDPEEDYGPTPGTFSTFSLFQPYLELRPYSLPRGFRFSARLSQRLRDGGVDIPGYWYEQNITLSHEYYGSLQYGAFPTRGWGVADYPYGTFVGLADAWGSSGSGYGLLTNALRLTFPPLEVFKGNLVFEVTYDPGSYKYDQNQAFYEYYIQFVRGKLVVDIVHQNAKNGKPGSWTHGPFAGLTDDPDHDVILGTDEEIPENEQRIWLLMGRYGFGKYEILAGYRRNYWSGSRAVAVDLNDDGDLIWNSMFNVHWDGERNGVANPGYPARSEDMLLGGRYFYKPDLIFSAGLVHLGEADTDNPIERGQSNSALIGSLGFSYITPYDGLTLSAGVSGVRYKERDLAPLSMPGHSAFTGVDSRVNKSGGAVGVTAQYNF